MLNAGKYKKILVVRNDRLGDLILSTPMFTLLRQHFAEAVIDVLTTAYAQDVLSGNPSITKSMNEKDSFLQLIHTIRKKRYDIALFPHSTFRVDLACFLARIRLRIGPLAKVYHLFFYNRIINQRRSKSLKHEADYNLELLTTLGIKITSVPTTVSSIAMRHISENIRKIIENNKPYIIVHPGMGDTALNWRPEHYRELLSALIQLKDYHIVVTGNSDNDKELIESIDLENYRNTPLINLYDKTNLRELMCLIEHATVVVGPSTGVLHMAVAYHIPVVTIYPPITVQNETRWGPYKAAVSIVHSPDVACPEKYHCRGKRCSFYYCMDTISPRMVTESVVSTIEKLDKKINAIPQ